MKTSFTIPFEVTSASRPRVTRYGTFYSKNYEAFRKVVGEWLDKQKLKHLQGCIRARFIFNMPIPKSWSKKKKEELNGAYMNSRKDLDNLEKSVLDVLQGRIFDDDCQIVKMLAEKRWTAGPGNVIIELEEVSQ
jgi:Holliday junction resolvase RusA-like endonuclease